MNSSGELGAVVLTLIAVGGVGVVAWLFNRIVVGGNGKRMRSIISDLDVFIEEREGNIEL